MSTPGLFVVGVLVTLIVAVALALLLYAAVLMAATRRRRSSHVSRKRCQTQTASR